MISLLMMSARSNNMNLKWLKIRLELKKSSKRRKISVKKPDKVKQLKLLMVSLSLVEVITKLVSLKRLLHLQRYLRKL